jgi:hypothetical protein
LCYVEIEVATADLATGINVEIEAGDDAKVVASATQRPIEVWEGGLVDVADCSIGEDSLIVDDVVACETMQASEE